MAALTSQELHNLAMNIVGKELEKEGFEFLAISSELTKDPQFVVLRNRRKSFVVVRAIAYPDDPSEVDPVFFEVLRKHAAKFEADLYYAGVGLANSADYESPVDSEEDYVINYRGLQLI